jgi:hypothetical protein
MPVQNMDVMFPLGGIGMSASSIFVILSLFAATDFDQTRENPSWLSKGQRDKRIEKTVKSYKRNSFKLKLRRN